MKQPPPSSTARLTMSIFWLFVCGCVWASSSRDPHEAKAARRTEQTIAALTRNTDADSLAAAGLLSLTKHREQSLPLIERAIAASPTRVDLVWLQSEVCLK